MREYLGNAFSKTMLIKDRMEADGTLRPQHREHGAMEPWDGSSNADGDDSKTNGIHPPTPNHWSQLTQEDARRDMAHFMSVRDSLPRLEADQLSIIMLELFNQGASPDGIPEVSAVNNNPRARKA